MSRLTRDDNYDINIPIFFNNPDNEYKDLEPGKYTVQFTVEDTIPINDKEVFETLARSIIYSVKNGLFIKEDVDG